MKAFLTSEEIAERIVEEALSDKERRLTAEQIEAIYTHGQNILVSASAGSGKTFVMVERMIDMIRRGASIDRLFVSTFTVKAAGELKERLEKRLEEELRLAQTEEERLFFSDQIAQLPAAAIGTMDAFAQQLLMQHGYLLGISPIFRVLTDKAEQDSLKEEVYADLFADYMRGDQAETFRRLVKNFAGNRKDSQGFRAVVDKIYQFSQATASPEYWLQEHFLKGYQTWTRGDALPDAMINDVLACLTDTANRLRELTESVDYPQLTKAGKVTATYAKHLALIETLEKLAADDARHQEKVDLGKLASEVAKCLPAGNDVTVAKVKYPIFKALHSQLAGLKHLDTILHYQGEALPLLRLLQAFVLDFSRQYLALKIQENSLEFSDIAHLAIRLLEEHPELARAFQDKYLEVMVDEYQDNNHMQERLLELLSNGSNRFMVGDIKQSIYRFRQADPHIFNRQFKTFRDHPEQGKVIVLKENFRSQAEVLEATNGVFYHLMDEAVGDVVYDQTHILVAGSDRQKQANPKRKTQVWIFNTDEETAQEDSETSESETLSAGEIAIVAKEIIRLHQEEGVSFSDISLLVSSRTRNEALLAAFDAYGIPLAADGGESHYLKSLEVMLMLETLRTIANPLNDYALVALLRSPMFHFDEDDLVRLARQGDTQPLFEKLQLAQNGSGEYQELLTDSLNRKLTLFLDTLTTWRAFAKQHSLYDLIWKIYQDRFYYDYVSSLPRGEQRQANLYALALRADQFEQTGFKGLPRFIRMIDQMLASQNDLANVTLAPPKTAVSLMTIHKSKGLEFPYVFILNCDKTFSMDDIRSPIILNREYGIGIKYLADMKADFPTILPHLLVSMETLPYQINRRSLMLETLSEQMRLLYVAMTRAKKGLYLIGKGSKSRLTQKFGTEREGHRLPRHLRESMTSFQDWLLALEAAFPMKSLGFEMTYVEPSEVTAEQVGQIQTPSVIDADQLANNRQSDRIKEALDLLDSVEAVNAKYQAAIALPTLRTPSQLKRFYEPMMDMTGVDLMAKPLTLPSFALPTFTEKKEVSAADIGSATHEAMQRLVLSSAVSLFDIRMALSQVVADEAVKERVPIMNIVAFFEETELGQLIQTHADRVKREAPFAMLKKDPLSGEDFVVRGIIDGYILLDDRIVLFDYKTDRYQSVEAVRARYQEQMTLYAEALRKSYDLERVEGYLVLLTGELQVVATSH